MAKGLADLIFPRENGRSWDMMINLINDNTKAWASKFIKYFNEDRLEERCPDDMNPKNIFKGREEMTVHERLIRDLKDNVTSYDRQELYVDVIDAGLDNDRAKLTFAKICEEFNELYPSKKYPIHSKYKDYIGMENDI